MSMQWKQSILLLKDKQTIKSRLEKGKKGTNLALKFEISKQQISDISKSKEEIMKFINNLEMSEGVKIHKYLQAIQKFK